MGTNPDSWKAAKLVVISRQKKITAILNHIDLLYLIAKSGHDIIYFHYIKVANVFHTFQFPG